MAASSAGGPVARPEQQAVALEALIDPSARAAHLRDQRTVYMWTFSHTEGDQRAKPSAFTRQGFANIVVSLYTAKGKTVEQWACFQEQHQGSSANQERMPHFHLVVQTKSACRWAEIADALRQEHAVFAHVTTASSRNAYWTAFSYCYIPSGRKCLADLDREFALSDGHPEIPDRLQTNHEGKKRVGPEEVYDTIVAKKLSGPLEFYAFARAQDEAGDRRWVTFAMRTGPQKLKEMLQTANALVSADNRLHMRDATQLDMLNAAASTECLCDGHAVAGWVQDSGERTLANAARL